MMEEKELIKLIDRYLDEALSLEETEEFNDLLENSKGFRDLFRSRVKLHGDLSACYEAQNSPMAFPIAERRPVSSKVVGFILTLAAILTVSVMLNFRTVKEPSSLAELTYHDSAQLFSLDQKVDLDLLTKGTYELRTGMLELKFANDVNLAIEGPANFELISAMEMNLIKGKISAHVGEKGKGFTVNTPTGEIIDLGTRFGVAVNESGKVEAHVFQGKINVVKQGRVTELIKDEALSLVDSQRISADQALFPLPGFPLDLKLIDASFDQKSALAEGWPNKTAVWGGDHCEIISSYEDLVPNSGKYMLRFIKPHVKGLPANGQHVSQVWQLVDLRGYSSEVERGGVTARLSAYFNKLSNLDEAQSLFNVSIIAFNGEMDKVKKYWDRKKEPLSELLASSSAQQYLDQDDATWENVETQLNIPSGTDFLLVQISVNNGGLVDFKGHFVDDVKLEVSTKARRSIPLAIWTGQSGDWSDSKNWQAGELPDLEREKVRVIGKGAALISSKVSLKQALVIATHNDSEGHVVISKDGELNLSSNGELLVGYNPGGSASLLVKGRLFTRGKSFIGRNNATSRLVVDGGLWDASGTIIRMSQYGSREVATDSLLEVKNGGRIVAKKLELVHDIAKVYLLGGYMTFDELKIGGSDGEAHFFQEGGVLKVEKITFGNQRSKFNFVSNKAELQVLGKWSVQDLLNLPNSSWNAKGKPLIPESLKVRILQIEGGTYSSFSLR